MAVMGTLLYYTAGLNAYKYMGIGDMKGEMCLRLRARDHFWARVRLRTDTIPGFSHLPSPSLFSWTRSCWLPPSLAAARPVIRAGLAHSAGLCD